MIYLDNAATTKPDDKVIDAVRYAMQYAWMNPSSNYGKINLAKEAIENVRSKIANLINCSPQEIIFTSGSSESNALAIQGFLKAHPNATWSTTAIEHHSILNMKPTQIIPVSAIGLVNREAMLQAPITDLYSIQMANNEIGTIQDMVLIVSQLRKCNPDVVIHTDATQAFGLIPIDVQKLDVDMMSVSGHKFGAPKGVGFLYVRQGIQLAPIIYGEQEHKLRGGTYNTYNIVGMGEALNHLSLSHADEIEKMRDELATQIDYKIPRTMIVGSWMSFSRLPNNLTVCFDGVDGETLKYLLGQQDIYVSTQSACNTDNIEPSHVLRAIQLPPQYQKSCIRFTFSKHNTMEEVYKVVQALIDAVNLLRNMDNLQI